MQPELTQNELGALGGQSMMNGGYRNAMPPAPMAPQAPAPIAPAPMAPRAPAVPTIGATLGTSQTQMQQLEAAKQSLLGMQAKLKGTTTPTPATTTSKYSKYSKYSMPGFETSETFRDPTIVDEKAIQRQQARLFQQEINATKQIYNQMYKEKQFEGEGRLGSTAALNARSGLLGSDFGQAQANTTQSFNRGILDGVMAEKQAKIGEIMGKVRKGVADEIAAKRKAQIDSADALIKFKSEKATRRSNNLSALVGSLLDQDIDINEVSPEDLAEIQKQTGLTKSEISAQFITQKRGREAASAAAALGTRKTESEISENEANTNKLNDRSFDLSEGQARYNPDGTIIASRAKTYAPTSGGSGGGGFKSGTFDANAETVMELTTLLNSSRGTPYEDAAGNTVTPPASDKYANTKVYTQALDQAVTQGALPQDFVNKFPPDLYLNPNDESLPDWIKTEMQKQTGSAYESF